MKIWILGEIEELATDNLPTVGEVLKSYYYDHLVLKNVRKYSIASVTKKTIDIWKASGKKTSEPKNVVRKLNQIVKSFELLKKGKTRRSKPQIAKEKSWKKILKNCFDITLQKSNNAKQRQRKNQQIEPSTSTNTISDEDFASDDSMSSLDDTDSDYSSNLSNYHQKQLTYKPSSSVLQKIINSPDVSSALDRTNFECGKFAIVAAAIGRACGDNISDEVFSLSTLKRRREKHRLDLANDIRDEFDQEEKKALVVHWDGKHLKDLTNRDSACLDDNIDRLAIVVNGLNVKNKIIQVSRLENGKGKTMSEEIYEELQDAGVLENIIGMCTDTTRSNTGNRKGACILLERKMKINLLYFACEHHVHEIILGGVYEKLFGSTKAPEEALFLKLKNNWSGLEDKNQYKVMDNQIFTANKKRRKLRQDVINFILPVLATRKEEGYFPQDNYREILELVLLLMGHSMPNYVIKKPGACHKARWMAPAIYALKIYLLRESMNLSDAEEDNLKEFCLFVCLVYVKSWTQCQIPSMAPENTLQLYKDLYNYTSLNATISEHGISKFKEHLWYIGNEMIFLSLFSSSVKPKDKQNIFEQMVLKDKGWTERNLKLNNITGLHKKKLHQLVGPSSLSALQALQIDFKFMYDFDAAKWGELEEYKKAKEVVDSLKVVNDCAERSLKIMTDFNGKLTKSETGTQQLIQVVQDNRNRISSTKKSVLSSYQRR